MKHYHNISIEQVIQALKTDIKNGLTSNEAKKRLEQNGANIISEKKKKSIIVRFFLQFNDFMILLLIGAAIISYITSIISKKPDIIEPLIILAIVIINAILGTAQESKAQKSIDALKKLSAPKARVLRNGKEITIDSSQIVCGDILIFNTGDIVCADCRLIESNSLLLGKHR